MRVGLVYDPIYLGHDTGDHVENGRRLESTVELLGTSGIRQQLVTIAPEPASLEDLLLVHSAQHIARVDRSASEGGGWLDGDTMTSPGSYEAAIYAAGGVARATEEVIKGDVESAFALVRPPGHHASRASAWGHCTFSNVALALLRLRSSGLIRSATLIDFDAHTGDGTKDVLRGWPEVQIYNGYGNDSADYLRNLDAYLKQAPQTDILAVSAGFDAYIHDLGHKLYTEDFFTIGRLLQGYAIRLGHQRRFAVLEGGYYLPDLGKNVLAFCRGFE